MGMITLDPENINNVLIPNIKRIEKSSKDAENLCNSLYSSLPSDFSSRNSCNFVAEQMEKSYQAALTVRTNVSNKVKGATSIEKKYSVNGKLIPSVITGYTDTGTGKIEYGWYETALSTCAVAATSVVSGVLKLGEYVYDGLTWAGGMIDSGIYRLFGDKETAKQIEEYTMNEIAKDHVGDLNRFFYENTKLGRNINDRSALKYDSRAAKAIQNITTEVVIIAGATAATVATGGAAAPLFAAGFLVGAGQTAEKKYQDADNRDFWADSIEIGIDGTIKGFSTVAWGKTGAAAVSGIKTVSKMGMSGIKEFAKQNLGEAGRAEFKQTIKTGLKTIAKDAAVSTIKDKDVYLQTASQWSDDIKSGLQTGEWNIKGMSLEALSVIGSNYIGNIKGIAFQDLLDTAMSNGQKQATLKLMNDILDNGEHTSGVGIPNKADLDTYNSDKTLNHFLDSMSDEERSNYWQKYYQESYGLENVENTSLEGPLVARKNAIDSFLQDEWISKNVSMEDFVAKIKKADSVAMQYEKTGVMDRKVFYDVWGAPSGLKPDPSEYLSEDYITNHLKKFSEGGARLVAEPDYIQRVGNPKGEVGHPGTYTIGGTQYTNGSEFISTKSSVDSIVDEAKKSKNSVGTITDLLGLGENDAKKYAVGVKRYDIDVSNLEDLHLRLPSGNEPGAFKLDWIPGGYTLGGTPEAIVDRFKLDEVKNYVSDVF